MGQVHLRYLNPLPPDLKEVLDKFDTLLIPELNLGQLAFILRAHLLRPVEQLNKVQGLPFRAAEIEEAALRLLQG